MLTKSKQSRKSRWSWAVVAVVVVGIAAGCAGRASSRAGEATATSRQALATSNGLLQNGLTTNGLLQNGLLQNGLLQNGLLQNGLLQNGLLQNGLLQNGLWQNGLWQNGLLQNGLLQNGLLQNGFWQNGLPGSPGYTVGSPGYLLQQSPYLRQFLQYLFGCAMPPAGTPNPDGGAPLNFDTTLDPNNGMLACAPDGSCDTGYTCSANNTCVVQLTGAVGLAINKDGTPWWGPAAAGTESGTCDESCQRWVSACLLARTNAYGVHVEISMRAPAVVPPGREKQFAAIQAALAPSADGSEVATYTNREGAYYGNIFATTPVTSPPASGSGPPTGAIAETPTFNACAGPDSNVPEITKRFCSSQGDQAVINVPGVCVPRTASDGTTDPGVCDSKDATGSINGCLGSPDTRQSSCSPSVPCNPGYTCTPQRTCVLHYDEVVTVYLKTPIAVCGNGVCEAGEDTMSSPGYCPSDCHPGWAKSFDVDFLSFGVNYFYYQGTSSVSPVDDTIVFAGVVNNDVSLGGDLLPVSAGNVVVAKYASDGTYLWGTQLNMPGAEQVNVVVAGDGSIAVAEMNGTAQAWVAKLTANGAVAPGWPIALGGNAVTGPVGNALAADSAGDVFLAGSYDGTATFATTPPTSTNGNAVPVYVVKLLPDGTPAWAVPIDGGPSPALEEANSLTVAPSGDVLLAADLDQTATKLTTDLYQLSTSTGAVTLLREAPWDPNPRFGASPRVVFNAFAADAAGALYATGNFHGSYDFGCGPMTAAAYEFFLVKYSPDGSQCQWVARATTECPPDATYCDGRSGGRAVRSRLAPAGRRLPLRHARCWRSE